MDPLSTVRALISRKRRYYGSGYFKIDGVYLLTKAPPPVHTAASSVGLMGVILLAAPVKTQSITVDTP